MWHAQPTLRVVIYLKSTISNFVHYYLTPYFDDILLGEMSRPISCRQSKGTDASQGPLSA